jgi:primosomal protein N' (replication factor Y)
VQPIAADLPVARLWVDTGVYHLDGPYDYLVPEKFSAVVQVGIRVEVEFGNSVHEGIVLERLAETNITSKLKIISKVVSPQVVATRESLNLFAQCSKRWAGIPFDFIRSAIPPRIASVDKEFTGQVFVATESEKSQSSSFRNYWTLPPSIPLAQIFAKLFDHGLPSGQLLIVCSTERELIEVAEGLNAQFPNDRIARLDANESRAERYRNFLLMVYGLAKIGIGLRGSIFTPLAPQSAIVVMSESSEHLYEPRSPGWNARDVAMLRSTHFPIDLILLGCAPSLEAARLIESKWMQHVSPRVRRTVIAQEQSQGALLPTKAFSVIRKALSQGPVLALVPRKGYGNAVLCTKCRNVGKCDCGGRLKVESKTSPPICSLCSKKYDNWHCNFCQSTDIYLVSRGIDRYVEEIGRAFPNIPIVNSSGENIIPAISHAQAIVVATSGAEPKCEDGYSAVAILEGLQFLAGSDVRAVERTREQFFAAARLASTSGTIFVTLDPSHPLVASLARWDVGIMINRELRDQEEAHLPPYHRFASIEVDSKEAVGLHAGILESIKAGRLPESVIVRGPYEIAENLFRITISAPIVDAPVMVAFMQELQRRRSISHKALLRIRIDPYSLA